MVDLVVAVRAADLVPVLAAGQAVVEARAGEDGAFDAAQRVGSALSVGELDLVGGADARGTEDDAARLAAEGSSAM